MASRYPEAACESRMCSGLGIGIGSGSGLGLAVGLGLWTGLGLVLGFKHRLTRRVMNRVRVSVSARSIIMGRFVIRVRVISGVGSYYV